MYVCVYIYVRMEWKCTCLPLRNTRQHCNAHKSMEIDALGHGYIHRRRNYSMYICTQKICEWSPLKDIWEQLLKTINNNQTMGEEYVLPSLHFHSRLMLYLAILVIVLRSCCLFLLLDFFFFFLAILFLDFLFTVVIFVFF